MGLFSDFRVQVGGASVALKGGATSIVLPGGLPGAQPIAGTPVFGPSPVPWYKRPVTWVIAGVVALILILR